MASNPYFPWSVSDIWNDSLITFDQRELLKRDYIYASEIGGSYIDRFLKMQAKKFSNPPNERSLRKFQAGNLWEWIVKFVLMRAGIAQQSQERVGDQLKGLLRVSGKIDITAGGIPDWSRAEQDIEIMHFPELIDFISKKIVANLKKQYGNNNLEQVVVEVKSVSSFVFERLEFSNAPLYHHAGQSWFYASRKEIPAKLFYVCRDDCRLKEFRIVPNDKAAFEDYYRDVKQMTEYYQSKKRPPKEPEFLFDEGSFKFRHNWMIEYSPYLTLVYGYKNPQEYRDMYKTVTGQYNRVFARCVECKTITKDNLVIIKEAKKRFPQWDQWIHMAKVKHARLAEVEEEEMV